MTCYNPLKAWFYELSGKKIIIFNEREVCSSCQPIQLPCGSCIGCLSSRARQWTCRLVNEGDLWSEKCFITLTYDDEHLPFNGSLNKKHFCDFMKRLRKDVGVKIRYFHCGEYGEKYKRPHYHAIIYNYDFSHDRVHIPYSDPPRYISSQLSRLWTYGFSEIGDFTESSCAYVAGYVVKKQRDKRLYDGKLPEYVTMSRGDGKTTFGIGKEWLLRYWKDVYIYGDDSCIVSKNFRCKPPRYYDTVMANEINSQIMEDKKNVRIEKMLEDYKNQDVKVLKRKEICKKEQIKRRKRNYEK